MKVLVIKDADGILRPGHYIVPMASEALIKAVREEWEQNMSKKKEFRGSTLVEAELTEIV